MIRSELHDEVAVIRFDRPAALNALDPALVDAALQALQSVLAAGKAKALLLTGSGRAFSAGGDIAYFGRTRRAHGEQAAAQIGEFMEQGGNALVQAIVEAPLPVICAVNGPCVGGAVGIALAADLVLAARSAFFLVPQVEQLGVVPDFGATWVLARLLGRARALGLSLLGERIGAERAEQWGMIWRCVDDAQLAEESMALAARLAALPTQAIVATRRLFDAAAAPCAAQLAREREAQLQLLQGAQPWQAFDRFLGQA